MEYPNQLHTEREPNEPEATNTTQSGFPDVEPLVYIASLTDYTNGRLHGVWIDADQPAEDIQGEIDIMLAKSYWQPAEEWAIHDYEAFEPFTLAEYEDLNIVSVVARGIAEHGRAFAHWASLVGTDDHMLDQFEDAYRGRWPRLKDYAEEFLDGMDGLNVEAIPAWLQPYVRIDIDQFARDLETDLLTSADSDGVHVFQAY